MSENVKRVLFYLFIFILIACYKDLQLGPRSKPLVQESSAHTDDLQTQSRFQIVSYQAQQGDSYLMILEKLNNSSSIDIEQAAKDFQSLNPAANIYELVEGNVYLFPLYK